MSAAVRSARMAPARSSRLTVLWKTAWLQIAAVSGTGMSSCASLDLASARNAAMRRRIGSFE